MEIISDKIIPELQCLIDAEYKKIESEFNHPNRRIHHTNIYHKDWNNNPSIKLLSILQDTYKIDINKIISMGFISGQPGCMDQHFHIDYDGVTETYFIPLCEITEKNGTEYLKFNNPETNIKLFETIRHISDKYIKKEPIIECFDTLEIEHSNYNFEILKGQAYCLVHMPNYILHRGRCNRENYIKVMFQIVLAAVDGANISSRVNFYDSELDEDQTIVERLLKSRSLNE